MNFPPITTTMLSDEFIKAVTERGTADSSWPKYPIEFNTRDWKVFIRILQKLAEYGTVIPKDFYDILDFDEDVEPITDWASDWLSGIGDTLNVEGI